MHLDYITKLGKGPCARKVLQNTIHCPVKRTIISQKIFNTKLKWNLKDKLCQWIYVLLLNITRQWQYLYTSYRFVSNKIWLSNVENGHLAHCVHVALSAFQCRPICSRQPSSASHEETLLISAIIIIIKIDTMS